MIGRTNFDRYLEDQLRDPDFAERFKRAGEAWDVALQLAALRELQGDVLWCGMPGGRQGAAVL